ncbi:MAG: hypothetical protein ACXVHQ_33570 [Solirubrobacteraceae bacterium]
MAEDMVLTPGGLRPKSMVYKVEPGQVLDGSDGRLRRLSASGEVLEDFGVLEARPGDRPLMPDQVAHPPAVASAFGSGWIAYAYWNNGTGTPLSSFATTWTVPPAPRTQSRQLIYLFNGIQNSTMIFQPVLQWGNNGVFGGNHWCVATWYADGMFGLQFHSTPVNVNAGDVLTGVMTLTGQSSQGFSYNGEFQGIANSGYPITNQQELTSAAEVLECYGICACSDYPDSPETAMSSISIQTGATRPPLSWTAVDAVTDCGQHAVVVSNSNTNGEVDLYYRGPVVVFAGDLWHTIRYANGGWQQYFGPVESQERNDPGAFPAISCAGVGNQLHMIGIVGGQLWHTIRNADGSWEQDFGLVEKEVHNDPGAFTAISCAGVGNRLHLIGIVGGQLWHTIRNADGSWQPNFGLVENEVHDDPGAFTAISCAGVGSQLHMIGIA